MAQWFCQFCVLSGSTKMIPHGNLCRILCLKRVTNSDNIDSSEHISIVRARVCVCATVCASLHCLKWWWFIRHTIWATRLNGAVHMVWVDMRLQHRDQIQYRHHAVKFTNHSNQAVCCNPAHTCVTKPDIWPNLQQLTVNKSTQFAELLGYFDRRWTNHVPRGPPAVNTSVVSKCCTPASLSRRFHRSQLASRAVAKFIWHWLVPHHECRGRNDHGKATSLVTAVDTEPSLHHSATSHMGSYGFKYVQISWVNVLPILLYVGYRFFR